MENRMEAPQKIKNKITMRSSSPTWIYGYISKRIKRRDMCTPMFIAALFTIAKRWKQSKYPPTDEWIKKI